MIGKKGFMPGSKLSDFIFRMLNIILSIRFFKKRRTKSNSTDINFVIFRVGGFGDYILSLDFVNQLVNDYPNASITVIGGPPLITLNFLISDKVQIVTSPIVNTKKISIFFKWSTIKNLIQINRQLNTKGKKNVFICAIRLETVLGALKCILFQKLAHPCVTFGYNTIGRGRFYSYSIFDNGYLIKHEREYLDDMLNLVKSVYPPKSTNELSPVIVELWDKQVLEVNDLLTIVIHAGGGSNPNDVRWINKRWDVNNYIDLINEMAYENKLKVYLTGSDAERIIAEQIELGLNDAIQCINLTGKTSIQDIFKLLKRSHLFIGSDSGISHIAGYINIPSVIMFAYSDHIGYAPLGCNTTILTTQLACAPCLYKFASRECLNTDWEFKCKAELSVNRVRKAVHDILEEIYPNQFITTKNIV